MIKVLHTFCLSKKNSLSKKLHTPDYSSIKFEYNKSMKIYLLIKKILNYLKNDTNIMLFANFRDRVVEVIRYNVGYQFCVVNKDCVYGV